MRHTKSDQINPLSQLQMYYWGEWTYLVIAAGYKIGILLFLLRIFPEKRFRVIVWCLVAFNAAWGVASVAMTIFQCWPIRKAWDWEQKVEGRCNDKHAQAWTAAAMGIILDLVILLLPIPSLIKLQLSGRKKLGLLLMFSCGILYVPRVFANNDGDTNAREASRSPLSFAYRLWSRLETARTRHVRHLTFAARLEPSLTRHRGPNTSIILDGD